jgi:hypothetical protein
MSNQVGVTLFAVEPYTIEAAGRRSKNQIKHRHRASDEEEGQ